MSNHETKVQANHLEIEKSCMKNYEELTEKDISWIKTLGYTFKVIERTL